MSVFEEIEKIKPQELASDMPEAIIATVLAASKTTGEYGDSLKLELQTEDGATFSTTYRIPKKLTGKGQMDLLKKACDKLKLKLSELEGKTFEWEKKELPGSMQGHPRHYPVKIV